MAALRVFPGETVVSLDVASLHTKVMAPEHCSGAITFTRCVVQRTVTRS